jgi:hypothetical protein
MRVKQTITTGLSAAADVASAGVLALAAGQFGPCAGEVTWVRQLKGRSASRSAWGENAKETFNGNRRMT